MDQAVRASDPTTASPDPVGAAAPRSVAVALTHRPEDGGAPRVAASGQGALAEQILQIAFAAGVKVRTDADLATLLSLVDVGEEIPAEAFVAVAEVLAYLYRASADGAAPAPQESMR